jgi:hypothetical protein
MSYIIKHKKKAFSSSAQRMLESTRYYEYEKREVANRVADELRKNPLTTLVQIYKEDDDAK